MYNGKERGKGHGLHQGRLNIRKEIHCEEKSNVGTGIQRPTVSVLGNT